MGPGRASLARHWPPTDGERQRRQEARDRFRLGTAPLLGGGPVARHTATRSEGTDPQARPANGIRLGRIDDLRTCRRVDAVEAWAGSQGAAGAPELVTSTAPIADECQADNIFSPGLESFGAPEHQTTNLGVGGSNPSGRASSKCR